MASKVMASRSPPNPDLARQSASTVHHHSSSPATTSIHQHHNHNQLLHSNDQSRSFGSMNMEEILKNIYCDTDNFQAATDVLSAADVDGGGKGKTVDEVWREIVSGSGSTGGAGGGNGESEMTLEDFLAKAGAVAEEDVTVPAAVQQETVFGVGTMMNSAVPFQPAMPHMQNIPPGGFGADATPFGVVALVGGTGVANGAVAVSGGGRGKRRAVEDVPLDKATQQKQRRMIKNRESAARSRERKQAYTVELEALVAQLEEENVRLLKEEAERNTKRYKQLMENLIPVIEKRRPPRVLRRVNSMSW